MNQKRFDSCTLLHKKLHFCGDVHCAFQKDDTRVQIRETSMRMSYSKHI